MLCPSAPYMIIGSPVKEGLPPVIQRVIKWRLKNRLSQRGASEVMRRHGLDVSMYTLQGWEQGHRKPGKFAIQALNAFLRENPDIQDPPQYRPGPKPGA